MQLNDSRAYLPTKLVGLPATGHVETFEKDGLHLFAKALASTTALSCPTYAELPVGLTFTLDNSNGSGSLTLTPRTGTATVVTTGKVYRYQVAASGALKATDLAAAPT
jgi:hypothetical protein